MIDVMHPIAKCSFTPVDNIFKSNENYIFQSKLNKQPKDNC